ncbi:MAG: magnesium chelatase, partial [Deltaproteobacteria bacterium]|nr:magnesium chelatase [Deltaproteobacteria bacterium]
AIEEVFIGPDLERYIVDLVGKTREHARVTAGASPRAGLALLKLTLGRAVIEKRDYVLPDDIKLFIDSVLIHRLILVPDLWMKAGAASDVIEGIVNSVPVPLLKEN